MTDDDEYWFAPKQYGYGAGFPVSWQGWALLGGYIAVVLLCGIMVEWDEAMGRIAAAFLLIPATIALILLSKARTRGGWRWRWGEKD